VTNSPIYESDEASGDRTPTAAITIDAFVEAEALQMTAARLKEIALFAPELSTKINAPEAARAKDFVSLGKSVLQILASNDVRLCRDPISKHLAEVGVAANYLLRGADAIPDQVPDIGLLDDTAILRKVFERNPELTPKL
jgi:uncharacterized membrane protein YkvA (DUF1232 family)